MLKYQNARVFQSLLLLIVLSLGLSTTSCSLLGTHKSIQIPPLLPLQNADKDLLIQEVDRLAAVKSIHAKVDIQFEDTSFASVGIAEKYRQVDGNLTLQRPGNILLLLQFTFVDIAQMASDGEHFAVAILQGDEKYKRFVKGTNSAEYARLSNGDSKNTNSGQQKSEKATVSALSNLRPQHLTDAFLIRPIDSSSGFLYSKSEFYQEEPDNRTQAKKGMRVMRGYYLLEELSAPKDGDVQVLRRFWFDRVDKVRLARLQTFDSKGEITTDVSYFNYKPVGSNAAIVLPAKIELTRPKDQYKLSISYQDPATVELNADYPPKAFVLQNKWLLPEVDLDAEKNKKVTANQ